MFNFIKERYYNLKDIKELSNIITYEKRNNIVNNIFNNKINNKYSSLKTNIDNNNILEYTKTLLDFFNTEKDVKVFKSYISLNKDVIVSFLDKNIDQIDQNKNDFRIKFLNFSVLNNLFENNKTITTKIYNLYFNDILKKENIPNIEKIQEIIKLFKEISNKTMTKGLFSKEFKKLINDTKEELLNDKNINIQEITTFENLNSYLYHINKNVENEYIAKVETIYFYNKIDFLKIDSKEYLYLLKTENIDKKLFNNIINNIKVDKNNVEDIYKIINKSDYKDDYSELLNKLKDNIDKIKKDRNSNILLATLLVGAAISMNNKNESNSLLNNVIDIGVDVGLGYGISDILER